jgi:hypothetical protein
VADRLAPAELDRLATALLDRRRTADAEDRQAARTLYRLLADGDAATADRLAAALRWERPHAQRYLDRLPDAERDDRGAVVGFGGLTLLPTAHQLRVRGQVRYAWCAWDCLFLPVALDDVIDVSSRCPHTGQPVRLTVAPTGVVAREPHSVNLSFVHPEAVDEADLRASFCSAVNFLADPAAAETDRPPGSLTLDLDDAFELGRRMIVERCGLC